MKNEKKSKSRKITLSDLKELKIILFGSARYRFVTLLITSGVFLLGGGSIRDYIILAIIEQFGAEKTHSYAGYVDTFSQVAGAIMVSLGIIVFIQPSITKWQIDRKNIKAQIIECWLKERTFTEEQEKWLQQNSKWEDKFWVVAKNTDLSKRERAKQMKKIR